jgi:hypothetical protein
MGSNGITVSFGKIEKGALFAIKKQIRAYLRNRLRGEELEPPRIWEDERRITFPGWPRETVVKALEYSYERMASSFRTPNPEIREATLEDLGEKEATEEDGEGIHREAGPPAPEVAKDASWTQHLIDKTTREVSEAYDDQIRRERAKTASLEHRVGSLLTDRDRLQKEKDEAEKARRSVEEQNDNLIKSMMSFADDPSKAALQVVSRAASWIRRLETQAKEIGGPPESQSIEDYFSVAKQDLVTYANSLLAPTGKRVESADELRRLTDPTPWEDTDYHKAKSADYLKAKEELEFVKGVESGVLRVPDSVRDLIIGGLQKAPREEIVQTFEARKGEHLERRNAGTLATQAERTHAYSVRLMELVANRAEKDPIPVAVIYRSDGDGGRIELRLPFGLDSGPISKFLENAVKLAAEAAGFRMEREEGPGKEQAVTLAAEGGEHSRAELLRMQGAFREALTDTLTMSALRGASVGFRVLDIRDFEV